MAQEPALFREADGLAPTVPAEFCARCFHEASLDVSLDAVNLETPFSLVYLPILPEELDVYPRRWSLEDFAATLRYPEVTTARRPQQPRLLQIDLGPSHSVREARLATAGQRLLLLG